MKSMKQFLVCLMAIIAMPLFGQKQISFAYVDSDYILGRMPEYKSAQTQLEDFAAKWEAEAQKMQNQLTQLEKDYQVDEIVMTSDQKKQKKEGIQL